MQIKPETVKKLRETTGLGICECQNALLEARGDFEKAALFLKKRSAEAASSKSGIPMPAGVVDAFVNAEKTCGAFLEAGCETEAAARSETMKSFVRLVLLHISESAPRTAEELLSQPLAGAEGASVRDLLEETASELGESVAIVRFSRYEIAKR